MDLKRFLDKGGAAGRRSLIALDFDGTLSPLVSCPGRARLPGRTRDLLARLASGPSTAVAVVSGRSLADVRSRIALPGLFYAGNHGLEIFGPGLAWTHPRALSARPSLQALALILERGLAELPGVLLENKGLTLSVHHRLSSASARRAAGMILAAALAPYGRDLTPGSGKMVWEVRPRTDWNKGHAVLKIGRTVGAGARIVFVGDDRTDEEGFMTLRGRAVTIRVGLAEHTAATHTLKRQDDVESLLEFLARMP
ncbi:MAG: trehalose-phosphatase [Elusimicrobiota bacterium]